MEKLPFSETRFNDALQILWECGVEVDGTVFTLPGIAGAYTLETDFGKVLLVGEKTDADQG